MPRPFVFQDQQYATDNIQLRKHFLDTVEPTQLDYCKAKFLKNWSKTPVYRMFLHKKVQFSQSSIEYTIDGAKSFSLVEKIPGEISGIAGYICDPIILLLLITVLVLILKSKIIKFKKLNLNNCLLKNNNAFGMLKTLTRITFSNKVFIIILILISLYNADMLNKIYDKSDFGGVYDSFRDTNEKIDSVSSQLETLKSEFESNSTQDESLSNYHKSITCYPNGIGGFDCNER